MQLKKYLIEKGKEDLLSSLKALDKKILNKKMVEYGVSNIYELKDYILEDFKNCLEFAKDDPFTKIYFEKLMGYEHTPYMPEYEQDIESLLIFVYTDGEFYSYYIPTEIKEIINKTLVKLDNNEMFNLENAANTPIIKDLKALLGILSIKDLKNIGKLLNIKKLGNISKKKLVQIIYDGLTDEMRLSYLISQLTDKESEVLKKLIKNKGTIQDNKITPEAYIFLCLSGITFLFRREDKFYISMCDNIYNVIKKINLKSLEKTIDENTKLYNLIKSMVNLYGIVSYQDLCDSYNFYYDGCIKSFDSNKALLFCERINNMSNVYINNELYFVHKLFELQSLESLLSDILKRRERIKRKPIQIDELLKYADDDYYEHSIAKENFKKYLEKNKISPEDSEKIIKNISDMYRLGEDFISVSLEMFQDFGLKVSFKNCQDIMDYLIKIYNDTRIWVNNGWTPTEMNEKV